ncbi:AAA family ATPase [Segnochrobactrum spirostomi]|uniref:AAA family ATPase n=1 Tax=Segnochrobactrum spirostomi TaxID=2608987 RepID=A0A6A7Y6T6_9HYPH|nr:AAA family ATPase [Segnochrobactrum spirostomi]MQT14415.1 AAA family ATPase [Segnochrobactrum spirostomi]
MNAITTDIVADPHDAIRAEVRQIMEAEGLSQAAIAKECGIAYGTFTPWMGATYQGDNNRISAAVTRWLETRRSRVRTAAVLPTAPDFVSTETAVQIGELMSYAQAAPDFGVVVGGAGIGKTTAIEQYARRHSNVHVMTAEPTLSRPNNMLSELADIIGVVERRSVWLSRAITHRLRGSAGLVVIDEAQHLSSQALDQLRTIHDKARIGVVVVGNESVFARLQGGGDRNAQFAQLYSRVGMRIVQPKPRAGDICALIRAWGIESERETALLKAIARKHGALRALTKTVRLASMLAAGAEQPLSDRHIRLAWSQLAADAIDA